MDTLIVCDDHSLFRNGIVNVIRGYSDFHVLSDVSSGTELICVLESGLIPDVILLDINMPNGLNGYQTAKYISGKFPSVKIIGLSMYNNELAELGMIMSGAKGFLPKTIDYVNLLAAISLIAKGSYCCFRNDRVQQLPALTQQDPSRHWINTLTHREMETALLMCSNKPYKQIADLLHISINTLDNIRTRIFEKMNCISRTEVAYFMMRTGLLNV